VKKVTSILLIVLVLLNVMGYYGVFIGLDYHHDHQLSEKFDTDIYNVKEAITLRIPIAIPYATESADFQRVDGEFEYMGNTYRLVKQRILNDTLYIVCVKDVEGQQIAQALRDYVKTFSGKPADAKSQSKTQITLIKDYIPSSYSIASSSEGWMTVVCNQTLTEVFVNSFFASIVHPPERG
jgi:hypothetical protein